MSILIADPTGALFVPPPPAVRLDDAPADRVAVGTRRVLEAVEQALPSALREGLIGWRERIEDAVAVEVRRIVEGDR